MVNSPSLTRAVNHVDDTEYVHVYAKKEMTPGYILGKQEFANEIVM